MLPRSVRHSPNIPYKPYKSFTCQLLGSTLHRFIKPLFLRFGEYTSIRLNSFGGGVHFPSKLANDPPTYEPLSPHYFSTRSSDAGRNQLRLGASSRSKRRCRCTASARRWWTTIFHWTFQYLTFGMTNGSNRIVSWQMRGGVGERRASCWARRLIYRESVSSRGI